MVALEPKCREWHVHITRRNSARDRVVPKTEERTICQIAQLSWKRAAKSIARANKLRDLAQSSKLRWDRTSERIAPHVKIDNISEISKLRWNCSAETILGKVAKNGKLANFDNKAARASSYSE